jgi:poly-gamma-glutamate capsule biosynthesis protein CapA/YwtB (metallophosphatase superfamily)
MEKPELDLMVVGDILLGAPEAEPYFDKVRSIFHRADVVVGQVEWPHTRRGQVCSSDMPAPAADPDHLKAVKNAGLDIATLASNHMFDQGPFGLADTVSGLTELGIATVGAGANIAEARKPAILEKNGVTVGVLAYNCVGPRESWATAVKAGTAHIHVMTHYELEYASPGSRPAEFSFPHPDHVEAMENDIRQLKSLVDVVVVVFHKGMVRIPVKLAHYERQVSRAAIDAGADAVVGHHAHILRGVEVYKGRPIYHGVNHFVAVYADPKNATMAPGGINMHDRHAFRKAFREPAPNDRDPNSNFRYAPESRHTMIAAMKLTKNGVETAGFIPCWINLEEQPEPFGQGDARGAEVVSYISEITRGIGSDAEFTWQGDRVVFLDAKGSRDQRS